MYLVGLQWQMTIVMSDGRAGWADGCQSMLTYLLIKADENKLSEVER